MHRIGASAIDAVDLPVVPFSANSPPGICPPLAQKYFCFSEMQIRCIIGLLPYPAGGTLRIVTTLGAGGNGRERCRRRSALIRGRLRRVVLTPRRWRQAGGGNFAGDGGKKARSPGRARYRLLKPLRGECRCDRGDYARVLCFYRTRGCGRIARPAFPAPSVVRKAQCDGNTRAKCAARTRSRGCSTVIAYDKREAFAQGNDSDPAFRSFAPQHRLPATPANGQWPSGLLLCIGAGQHRRLREAAPQARIPNKSRGRIYA
jgi:hypothetical protein